MTMVELASRVQDLPEPGLSSSKRACAWCREEVWVPLGKLPAVAADRLVVICKPCWRADR